MGLDQLSLARQVNKSRSAICQYEKGYRGVLSEEVVKALCEFLGVPFASAEKLAGEILAEVRNVLAFCKNELCPVANVDLDEGQLVIQPKMYYIWHGADSNYCIYCRKELETSCSRCLTPLVPGAAFCGGCDKPLVRISPAILEQDNLPTYVRQRAERRNRFLSSGDHITELPRPVHKNSARVV